jgi:hypothetical protein
LGLMAWEGEFMIGRETGAARILVRCWWSGGGVVWISR